jgi:hypothetical protein
MTTQVKFRTIVGEKKEEPKREEPRRELAEIIQATESVPAQQGLAPLLKETTDVGQFMRFVVSTIAKLPPEERTFVRFLIAPKATPLVMNDKMIDVIYKNIDLLEEPHIETLSKTTSLEDLVKLAEKFNSKLAALIAILTEKRRP